MNPFAFLYLSLCSFCTRTAPDRRKDGLFSTACFHRFLALRNDAVSADCVAAYVLTPWERENSFMWMSKGF
jgi:hypothetical protein